MPSFGDRADSPAVEGARDERPGRPSAAAALARELAVSDRTSTQSLRGIKDEWQKREHVCRGGTGAVWWAGRQVA